MDMDRGTLGFPGPVGRIIMKSTIIISCLALFVLWIALSTPATGDNKDGIELFKKSGCPECHAISALGLGVVKSEVIEEEDDWGDDEGDNEIAPPDLSNVGTRHDAKWISNFLRKKVANDGRYHKKRFQGGKDDRRTLALWLATLKLPVAASTASPGTNN